MQYFEHMPGGNVHMVQRACAAWCEGDISIYREMYAPDVVASGGRLWPEGEGSVAGVDAVIRNFESLLAAFERSELIPESYLEAGETLVVRLLWRGLLRGSETPVEQRLVCAYKFRDGLIAYTAWFEDIHDALRAVGLPESAESELTPVQAEPPVASGGRAPQPGP
jgi:ketosteroid isomerase-like protein